MHPRLVLGNGKGVLIREVSSFQGSLIEGLFCIYSCSVCSVIETIIMLEYHWRE